MPNGSFTEPAMTTLNQGTVTEKTLIQSVTAATGNYVVTKTLSQGVI